MCSKVQSCTTDESVHTCACASDSVHGSAVYVGGWWLFVCCNTNKNSAITIFRTCMHCVHSMHGSAVYVGVVVVVVCML